MKNNDTEKRLLSLEERVKKLEEMRPNNINQESGHRPTKKLAINEFIRTKKLSDDVKRTLAIAYYLDYFEKLNSFNAGDLKREFRLAKLSIPTNINDKVNVNIRNGHIAEDKEKKDRKKAWYITNKGSEFVENELNN